MEFTVYAPDDGEPPYTCKPQPGDRLLRIAASCCGLVPWGMFYFTEATPSGPQSGSAQGCSGCFVANSLRCGVAPTEDDPLYLYAGGAEIEFSFYVLAIDNLSTNPECGFCTKPTCKVDFSILFPDDDGEYYDKTGRPKNRLAYTMSFSYSGGFDKSHSDSGCGKLGLGITVKVNVDRGDPRQGFVPVITASTGGHSIPVSQKLPGIAR